MTKKEIREAFRTAVFTRDHYACRVCETGNVHLDAHHITDRHDLSNGGYVVENGVSLCNECHDKAETWHASGGEMFIEGYHPDQLYALIGSSYEIAFAASERLVIE